MRSISDLTRPEKVSVYVIGLLDDLRDKGLIDGGMYQCAENGKKLFLDLKVEGFRPTEQEIHDCMTALNTDA